LKSSIVEIPPLSTITEAASSFDSAETELAIGSEVPSVLAASEPHATSNDIAKITTQSDMYRWFRNYWPFSISLTSFSISLSDDAAFDGERYSGDE
jgi:hypothetical protein